MIARVLGVSRNTVRAALASDGPPRYVRRPAGSIVDAVEPRIRELLAAFPTMPATVIAERVGWTRGKTVLADRVRELRPVYLPLLSALLSDNLLSARIAELTFSDIKAPRRRAAPAADLPKMENIATDLWPLTAARTRPIIVG